MEEGRLYLNARNLTTSDVNFMLVAFTNNKRKKIKFLSLRQNYLDEVPDGIRLLPNLTCLRLRRNRIKQLPEWIGTMTALEELELCENQLCIIPDSIGNLTALRDIGFDCNKIRCIPASIGKLTNLTGLSCCKNELSTISRSIGNLSKLKYCGLGNNCISSLPSSFARLTSLQDIFLAGNQSLPNRFQQDMNTWDRVNIQEFTNDIAFEEWRENSRTTTIAWILVAKRIRLHRDVAVLIAKLIYGTRKEDVWEIEN